MPASFSILDITVVLTNYNGCNICQSKLIFQAKKCLLNMDKNVLH